MLETVKEHKRDLDRHCPGQWSDIDTAQDCGKFDSVLIIVLCSAVLSREASLVRAINIQVMITNNPC